MKKQLIASLLLCLVTTGAVSAATRPLVYNKDTKSLFPQDVKTYVNKLFKAKCNPHAKYVVAEEITNRSLHDKVYIGKLHVYGEVDSFTFDGTDEDGKNYRERGFSIEKDKAGKLDWSHIDCEMSGWENNK